MRITILGCSDSRTQLGREIKGCEILQGNYRASSDRTRTGISIKSVCAITGSRGRTVNGTQFNQ